MSASSSRRYSGASSAGMSAPDPTTSAKASVEPTTIPPSVTRAYARHRPGLEAHSDLSVTCQVPSSSRPIPCSMTSCREFTPTRSTRMSPTSAASPPERSVMRSVQLIASPCLTCTAWSPLAPAVFARSRANSCVTSGSNHASNPYAHPKTL